MNDLDIKTKLLGQNHIKPMGSKVTEKEYYIHPKLKRDLDGIIATAENITNFGTEMGDRNYILSGPPGTGKSLGAKYIANRLGFPICDGKTISNAQDISKAFKQLRSHAKEQPLILLINELDKFSNRENIVDPTQQQTLNQLLDEMDGVESNNGIFVIGTTNRPNNIDPALRRAKRFSKEIEFMPPDKNGRLAILKIHAHGKGGHKFKVDKKDLDYAAGVSYGYTGADLVGLLNEAFTNAQLDKRTNVKREDIEYALTKTKPSALKDMPFREPSIKFKDLGGYDNHKGLLKKVVENSNGSIMLFYGPKGTGKTAFAEALAGEYGYNYMVIGGSQPMDKWVGETGKMINKYLDRAKQLAPCVLLFDEFDSLVEQKGITSHKSSWTGLLQSKLSKPIKGVYLVGTVNRPDNLTGTFLDRFIHKLYFGMPTAKEQEHIWAKYLPKEGGIKPEDMIKINGKLSCRDITRADRMVKDYGVKPSIKVYKSLIEDITPPKENLAYKDIVKQVGDNVGDYSRIKGFIDKK